MTTPRPALPIAWWVLAALAVIAMLVAVLVRPLAPALDQPSASAVANALSGVPGATLERAHDFRAGQRWLLLAGLLLRLGAGVALLLSRRPLQRVVDRLGSRREPLLAGLAGVVLWAAVDLLVLPLQYVGFTRSRAVGLSIQSGPAWLRDWLLTVGPTWIGVFVTITFVAWLARRAPRSWVPAAGVLVGLASVVVVLASPLVLEPLVLNFTPLPDGRLRSAIEELSVRESGEPPGEVLVADASRRGTETNAYVSGLFGTRRIVLYDTLLDGQTPDEEILQILAHELAHDAHHDIERSAVALVGVSVLTMVIVALVVRRSGLRPSSVVPVMGVLLVAMVLLGPVASWASRRAEAAADAGALELTEDPGTVVEMMEGLAERNLSDPEPPAWAVALWYTHPPVTDRILAATHR